MNNPERLARRVKKIFDTLNRVATLLATMLTILAALGFGSVALGFFSHILPLTITGIAVIILSILLFIFFYTLLEERTEVKAIATNTAVPPTAALTENAKAQVRAVITTANQNPLPSQNEEKALPKPIPTDTIVYPTPHWEDEVEILLKEIVYEYASDGQTMWQRKHIQLKMLRNGVRYYTDRYRWTGMGKCVIKSLTSGFNIINQRKEEIWDYFDVDFPHPLHKEHIIDFTIEWELVDERNVAIPFLSTMIDRDTKHLLLRVILPRELTPKRAYCYEFANYVDTLPIATQEIPCSPATRILVYDVLQPKRNHKYLIRWYTE